LKIFELQKYKFKWNHYKATKRAVVKIEIPFFPPLIALINAEKSAKICVICGKL